MQKFSVNAAFEADAPIVESALVAISTAFRPDDESCCVWIDRPDLNVLVVSYDLVAANYEDAVRECKLEVLAMLESQGLPWRLMQVGAATDEGYVVSNDPSLD